MDILTHTLSGLAVGSVVATFSNKGILHQSKIILASAFAGALPDLDAISYWSGFDATFGTLFNLPAPGRDIYSAKYWYSHHAFMHSLVAGLFFAFTLIVGSYLWRRKTRNWRRTISDNRLLATGFILGFTVHLLEDMPTPAASWGGVNFLWPSASYIGGTGDIWWWNNYDIFLIVVSVIIINLVLSFIHRWARFNLKALTVCVFAVGFGLSVFQIKTRDFDFAYTGSTSRFQEFESKSKELQQEILGDKLFYMMEKFDHSLSIYF